MKFITERQLRGEYKQAKFSAYPLSPDEKLTPEARQFLTDRKISIEQKKPEERSQNISDDQPQYRPPMVFEGDLPHRPPTVFEGDLPPGYCPVKIKFQWVLSLFLLTEAELIHIDPILAESISVLEQYLKTVMEAMEHDQTAIDLPLKCCTGIQQHNWSVEGIDCFEVSSFHLQLKKGREIIQLNYLRSSLRELIVEMERNNPLAAAKWKSNIFEVINQISQLICQCMGGDQCQRV